MKANSGVSAVICNYGVWLIAALCVVVAGPALAQATIDVTAMEGELATGFTAYLALAIQVISVIVFLGVGYGVVVKFFQAINGRAAWGEVMMPVLVGAFVLVVTAYFFTQASAMAAAIA